MGHCLSSDLRNRVVGEVEKGSSCRSAAARFGVSAASAIRWVQAFRKTGSAAAKPQGGDHRSKRIEAHRAFILKAVADRKDITLAELQERLARRGARFGIGTIWRFFDRHGITLKKRRRTPPNKNAPMSADGAKPGSRASRSWSRNGSSS
jgi:transposase